MKKIILSLVLSLLVPVHVESLQQLTGVIVVIDPGHGGLDNGAIDNGYNEDDLNLKISLILKDMLEDYGAKVYMTRDSDYDMTKRNHHYSKQDDMYLRVKEIDSYHGDYLLSIHQNSSLSHSAWGSQVFYYYRSKKGKILANSIDKRMKKVTHSRKPISGSGFRVLRATKTLGVLIECGFMSHYNEGGQLRSKVYQKKLAKQICLGLIDEHKRELKEKKEEIKKLYLK